MTFAIAYKRFRGTSAFVFILCSIICIVVVLHYTIGFDPDWGGLNLFLSVEASVSMAIFMGLQDKMDQIQAANDNFQRDQLVYMRSQMEAERANSQMLIVLVEEVRKLLEENKAA